MLLELHVKNLALIEKADVEFGEGLNILTGETGAGKQIIIGSVTMALGGKASKDVIRRGADHAYIELIFFVDSKEKKKALMQLGTEPTEEGMVIISRKIMMEVLPYLNIPQTEEITDELLQELELTREDVENGRNAALIKEKSETTETDEYGNVISSGTTAETDEYGNVISSGTTAETDEYGNVISSGTTSGSTSSATGTTDAQTSQTDAYGNVISGSDSTTQGTTDDEGSAFHSNIPAPLQSQDSGDGVSTQDWITNEKLGIDENNNSYQSNGYSQLKQGTSLIWLRYKDVGVKSPQL